MSSIEQRKQWGEHMADEAKALALQQSAAGGTHSPVEGPLPHTEDDVAAAVARAVAAERQRCAAIAERWSDEAQVLGTFADFTEWELRAAVATARAIGNDMRREG
jgi:hypothetical protein